MGTRWWTEMSRKERVFELLAGAVGNDEGGWVDTMDVCHPDVGGSEGMRRLRELRNDGNSIEKRKKKGSSQWQYRLIDE